MSRCAYSDYFIYPVILNDYGSGIGQNMQVSPVLRSHIRISGI